MKRWYYKIYDTFTINYLSHVQFTVNNLIHNLQSTKFTKDSTVKMYKNTINM